MTYAIVFVLGVFVDVVSLGFFYARHVDHVDGGEL
jgi:hypothetical protein